MSQHSQRKDDHLKLAKKLFSSSHNELNQVHLMRPVLPEIALSEISLTTKLFNKIVSAPFFINAMTGGSANAEVINRRLAQAAAKENIAMSLGSASILEKEPKQLNSFLVARQENPHGFLFANVNPNTSPKTAAKIVKILSADALQIHLNVLQEIVMPEGDRNFHWLDNLKRIQDSVEVPVILKEVGNGISKKSLAFLKSNGFEYIDIGGSGGTDFATIENNRREKNKLNFIDDLNLSTAKCLLGAQENPPEILISSGGITTSMDIFKSLILGADFVGVANLFLQHADSTTNLIQLIQQLKSELTTLCAIFGISDFSSISNIDYYLDSDLFNYFKQINTKKVD
ncbi:type 2 isopentenyl-diphosphate Delta-isomerase [Lactobacillus sp. PV012]|uniref:type 2 isopentenyl-diphosphate Delta-isomerase n=1 Tax=Lactobacillus sp. PV012 TaxID=2594494 RepID=UPI0022409CFA|nr:type 2 isopentenyl-diphosphate Delta-isomerase [Lactobacillus sp. PV012]QNQ82311.1 type 2 isopentenyl-diphosphate Delta-isomerase [Lactobacillus sp. PV012]